MRAYIIKRLLGSIPLLLFVALAVFWVLQVLPGNPITVMMGEKTNPQVIARLTQQMRLNDPFWLRFLHYLSRALQGDLGVSYKLNRPIADLILEAFPHTVKLALTSALTAWVIGIPFGIFAAIKQNSPADRLLMGISLMGISLPVFWAAMLAQYIFSARLSLFPLSGYTTIRHMVLPALVLGWSSSGSIARLTRSSLLDVMKNDYIRTARAKGVKESLVVLRHGLKNAMPPVITMMAMQLASLLSGAVMTETVFGIGGLGLLTLSAVNTRDMPLLQGCVMFSASIIILGNLAADLLSLALNPNLRKP